MDSLTPIYVSEPVLNKDGINSFTSYTLQGTRVPESLIRRYRDFDALRKKFLERWPGIFIPGIPHKKIVGSTDKDIVEMRIEMINRFLNKISNIGYLFNSEEMDLFLQSSSDVGKTLNTLSKQNYEDLLRKYTMTFTDYDDNYDPMESKVNQGKFLEKLKSSVKKITTFKNSIEKAKKAYQANHETHLLLISMISLYEKEALKDYCHDKEEKLIFFNTKNINICKTISEVQENLANPFEKLFDAISGDLLDTEAMIEALLSIQTLQETLDKLNKKQLSVKEQIDDLTKGNANFKNIISLKLKPEDKAKLEEESKHLETDITSLGNILKICCFNMDNEISNFKIVNLESYYNELNKLETTVHANSKILNDLWAAIINDENMKSLE